MKKSKVKILLWGALLFFPLNTFAIEQQVDLRADANGEKGNGNDWSFIGSVYTRYTLDSNRDETKVKGEFSIEAYASPTDAMFGVYRAFVKARLGDYVSLTVGKAPITWGEGEYYNAGDLFFDSSSTGKILSSDDKFRDNSEWMVDLYFSLGMYTYLELICVAPAFSYYDFIAADYSQNIPQDKPDVADVSGGWRLGTKLWDVQMQFGGVFKGEDDSYASFMSFSGGIADKVDWYVSTRLSVSSDMVDDNTWMKTWDIAVGLYYVYPVTNGVLSFRAEALFRPYQDWKASEIPHTNNVQPDQDLPYPTQISSNLDNYGSEVFVEMMWNATAYLSLLLRNVFSPIDLSDYIYVGLNFTPYNNFTLSLNTMFQIGGENDLFGFNRDGGVVVGLEARYVFS